ncbi:MAG: hypothetical protein MZW92_18320 [Comamonadaceae bacterium]|nr:hypothetical protein [Comamonadaceae bacterium]
MIEVPSAVDDGRRAGAPGRLLLHRHQRPDPVHAGRWTALHPSAGAGRPTALHPAVLRMIDTDGARRRRRAGKLGRRVRRHRRRSARARRSWPASASTN